MTDQPWDSEPDTVDFEAEGLPCAMRRNGHGVWCGYVGVGADHPLHGLPTNHPLKLPQAWFSGRRGLEGTSEIDLFIHALRSGERTLAEACPISLAFQVHGGVNFADDGVPHTEPGERWWFGFDCGHAGDYLPAFGGDHPMIEGMPVPQHIRDAMRREMRSAVYRDQQYVVSECQSLAAQLIAIVAVIDKARA
jgi:hypothetical protein